MNTPRLQALTLATAGCAMLLSPHAAAQVDASANSAKARFAAPKRIQAGDAFVGEGRYYPSPVLHDVNKDGLADIVIGDLMGKVTWAPRIAGTATITFGKEEPFNNKDGKQLKFHNW